MQNDGAVHHICPVGARSQVKTDKYAKAGERGKKWVLVLGRDKECIISQNPFQ